MTLPPAQRQTLNWTATVAAAALALWLLAPVFPPIVVTAAEQLARRGLPWVLAVLLLALPAGAVVLVALRRMLLADRASRLFIG